MEPVGVYISVPFCRAKCTFCNFASDAFGAGRMDAYVERLCGEIGGVRKRAAAMGAVLPELVDTVYFGGGTPSLLSAGQMWRIFGALRGEFAVERGAEITLECAPGQLAEETLEELLGQGMNRVSLGVQSFVDAEAAGVGRLHTRAMCRSEAERLQAAGIKAINVDLIAGLPLQTAESWRFSVEEMIASGVGHGSVYMLEVDDESRLGREALAGGTRYGVEALPEEDAVAEWYGAACEWLGAAGVRQYEISNFAQAGSASRHNLKYWKRKPYVGFGLDAHSMLRTGDGAALRFSNGDSLDGYVSELPMLAARPERVDAEAAFEEALFLGLRLNVGVDLGELRREFGAGLVEGVGEAFAEVLEAGLVWMEGERVGLTARGRVVSNEVFARLLVGSLDVAR
jgi:oxygen-independent coproporphyrinogen-3 oxidase